MFRCCLLLCVFMMLIGCQPNNRTQPTTAELVGVVVEPDEPLEEIETLTVHLQPGQAMFSDYLKVTGLRINYTPQLSDRLKAFLGFRKKKSPNVNVLNQIKQQATQLRAGLEFPSNTFAADIEHDIIVAHHGNGDGVVIKKDKLLTRSAGEMINFGWLTYEKRGDVWRLTHYQPK